MIWLSVAGAATLLAFYFLKTPFNFFPKAKSIASNDRQPFPPLRSVAKAPDPTFDDFLGAEACADCHQEQYDLWKNSTHGRAGGAPALRNVIGVFDGQPRRFKDAVVTPTLKNQKYLFTVEQEGFPQKIFQVDAVIGGGFMEGGGSQTYFSRFPDGTLRFLPFDFIRKEKVWFGETKGNRGWVPISEALSITDLSEWPPSRILGAEPNFNNCQECHGSQIQTVYDARAKKYVTKFKSLSINCESCHGPGKRHVELAKSGKIEDATDIGMQSLAALGKDESLEVCFRCHTLKDAIANGYLPGRDLQEYYALKFPILGENPYHPDGRTRAFAYQEGHLFSDCYLNGSMTCVDCHDPHAQNYRDLNGVKLHGRFDNGQCTGCHASKALSPERHSHHKKDSPANLCTSCHMPFLQHPAMGTRLRFARADHTIPIPRPEFDAKLGIENACAKCHAEKATAWLQAKTVEWYGEIKPHKEIVMGLMQAPNLKDRRAVAALVLEDSTTHVMAQVAGLCYFTESFLRPHMRDLEAEAVEKLKRLAAANDLDLKALALMSLHLAQDHIPAVRAFLLEQLQALGDHELLIRRRWSMALAFLATRYRDRGETVTAVATYRKALEVKPDDAATLLNLGITYSNAGDLANAITCYQQAARLAPENAMIWVNWGIALRRQGNAPAAIETYRRAIDINPHLALAHFNLGNVYYERDDYANAIPAYEKAVELDPSLATAHFFLARAYIKTKEIQPAARAIKAGLQYDQQNNEARKMLAELETYLAK
ncbi:MAG: tetratricopeptide repeat protein [candidate division KSB1 bacterium]|nr:tetratricopeptide repeat protein [candidate division KSB1 bacterium]